MVALTDQKLSEEFIASVLRDLNDEDLRLVANSAHNEVHRRASVRRKARFDELADRIADGTVL